MSSLVPTKLNKVKRPPLSLGTNVGPTTMDIVPSGDPTFVQNAGSVASSTVSTIPTGMVFITGMALVVTNNAVNGVIPAIWNLMYQGTTTTVGVNGLKTLGGELLFVVIMSFIASINDDVNNVVFALFIGLWLVWAINNQNLIQKWTSHAQSLKKKGT